MQSDIRLLNNKAYGQTQGFTSFDPDAASGIRISMIGNWVETSMSQGIACYDCFDSVITDNTLITMPGALYRTFLRVPGGANNIVMNNTIGPRVSTFDTPLFGAAPAAGLQASAARFAAPIAGFEAAGEVPEPAQWLQLLAGFAVIGTLLRCRRPAVVPAVQLFVQPASAGLAA